jgi:hypothetical protein
MSEGGEMKKQKQYPNHHMGKHSGYELIDGEYHIAPMYTDQFRELENKVESINALLQMVNTHCASILEEIAKARRRIWDDIFDDIGLDRGKSWLYVRGVIKEAPKKQEVVNE